MMTKLQTIDLAHLDTVIGGAAKYTEEENQANKAGCLDRVKKSDKPYGVKDVLSLECEKQFLRENFHNFSLPPQSGYGPGSW